VKLENKNANKYIGTKSKEVNKDKDKYEMSIFIDDTYIKY
jgi:hypothetical protein